MTRYTTETVRHEGERLVELCDTETGARARLWPAFGNNCFEAQLPSPRGGLIDLLLAPDTLNTLREHPSGWGIPLLFPSPGRIRGGIYFFQGHEYVMSGVDASGNVLHGFALRRAWRVDKTAADDEAATVTCSFSSADNPGTLAGYPFRYRVETTYQLDSSGLTLAAVVANQGSGPMPFGFGMHPYFRIPFRADGRREDCLVKIPASGRWDLGALAKLKGKTIPPREKVVVPVEGGLDYRHGVPLGDRQLDDVLTDLTASDGWTECVVTDPAAGLESVMRATDNFGTAVVYTPPDRPGLCFEPWTCPPNAFNLAAAGMEKTGLLVLPPGGTWEGRMHLSVRKSV